MPGARSFGALTSAGCSNRDDYQTLMGWKDVFVCLSCIEHIEELRRCGWCGDATNGDMAGSPVLGCSACDGNMKLLYKD
ncbi:hypothetical protein [Sphingomonas panni]|uniref:hypothetical protein n=1 Tax=Sphingomonas panni TaxID=237612 RepID=UPI001F5BCE97|nr:hypothetical protein [Sphingomonas panni]